MSSINWNNAADADGYVVVQEKQKRKILGYLPTSAFL